MKAKYLVLAALAIANFPIYRAVFRVLFRGMARKSGRLADPSAVKDGEASEADAAGREGTPSGETLEDSVRDRDGMPKLGDFRDPEFLHDEGGEYKIFLLVLASVLVVLIEYYALLSIFPALREAVLLGMAACPAAISC